MKTYDSFQQGDGRLRKQFERFYQRTWSHPIDKDREWNDGAARKQALIIFEAAGHSSEVARHGRRKLSAILFS